MKVDRPDNRAAETASPSPRTRLFSRDVTLSGLLVLTLLAVYWPVFGYPHIQDDWGILRRLVFDHSSDYLLQAISPVDRVFFRPVGELTFFLLYQVFGINPIGFHLVGMALHTVASLLLVRLFLLLTASAAVAWGAGWLYAVSATVHLEPLLWMVGLYELITAVCLLAALLSFAAGRPFLSALFFLIGLLAKEAAVVTLPVLFLLVFLLPQGGSRPLRRIRSLWPHVVIALAYLAIKAVGTSPLRLSPEHPYAVRFAGRHIKENLISYSSWAVEALIPFKFPGSPAALSLLLLALAGGALVVGLAIVMLNLRRRKESRVNLLFGLGVWAVLGVLPVLFLPQQIYKYYLTLSLMPLVAIPFLLISEAGVLFRWRLRIVSLCIAAFSALNIIGSGWYVLEKHEQGFREGRTSHSRGGENHLIRKGSLVRIVERTLSAVRPEIPSGSILLFTGLDIRVFHNHAGPQVWYGDSTLRAYNVSTLDMVPGGFVVPAGNSGGPQILPGGGGHEVAFRMFEGALEEITMGELLPPSSGGVPKE